MLKLLVLEQSDSQNGSQRSERFYNKIMVICFGTGISFGSLAKALKKEGCGSDPIGYQMVDFNQTFASVQK